MWYSQQRNFQEPKGRKNPHDEWIKQNVIWPCKGILSSHKKTWSTGNSLEVQCWDCMLSRLRARVQSLGGESWSCKPWGMVGKKKKRKMKYWCMLQHGWVGQYSFKWKKTVFNLNERRYIVWFDLCDMSRIGKTVETKQISGCLGLVEQPIGSDCWEILSFFLASWKCPEIGLWW